MNIFWRVAFRRLAAEVSGMFAKCAESQVAPRSQDSDFQGEHRTVRVTQFPNAVCTPL